MSYTATYSPDDNKLRLYSLGRLPADLYARVKAAGFGWAPKQDLFVAPRWTPHAEDLLLDLCGEIDDEDKSLAERAEERADRFGDYSEARAGDAESARKAVSAIADNIPLGQPILVGHHSERHARKDAERIENGMRRAVKMWETSQYWTQRAAGAIRHAKYKERPDVRARRIKGIEADKRKQERTKAQAAQFLKVYADPDALGGKLEDGRELIPALLGTYEGGLSFEDQTKFTRGELAREEAQAKAMRNLSATVGWCDRWLAHYENRLAYERAMLADAGGTVTDRTGPEKGGACKCWASPRGGWSLIQKVNKVSVTVLDNWGNGGRDFTRTIPFDKLAAVMSKAEVDAARAAGRIVGEDLRGFGLCAETPAAAKPAPEPKPEAADFEAMRETLRAGVQVVSAPQLFPTPPDLAARLVELAEIEPHHRVLEPSAGTGNILRAIGPGPDKCAVEVNSKLVDLLARSGISGVHVHCADFLSWGNTAAPSFDRVVMNPPFADAADIKHIRHALDMLKPGGRLVAVCANGPRQREQLQAIASDWIDLPAGTFKEAGTGVNTAIVIIDK